MRSQPTSLPKNLGEATRDTSPVEPLTDRVTAARTPSLQGSLPSTPNVGLPPSRAACTQRERWVHQSRPFPVEESTTTIRGTCTELPLLQLRSVESMLYSSSGLALGYFQTVRCGTRCGRVNA